MPLYILAVRRQDGTEMEGFSVQFSRVGRGIAYAQRLLRTTVLREIVPEHATAVLRDSAGAVVWSEPDDEDADEEGEAEEVGRG